MKQRIFLFLAVCMLMAVPCMAQLHLNAVTISGPTEIMEGRSAYYHVYAHWCDGSVEDVTSSATFYLWSNYATISGNKVTTGQVDQNEVNYLSADYGGVGANALIFYIIDYH
ncbi:MAG: hypothetical protein NT166_30670 [Candidatus Aminicenantes bacterium]|nr:hypothetical protein [Candidatus Aminicenantes bacterium]